MVPYRIIKRMRVVVIGIVAFCFTFAYFSLFTAVGGGLLIKWIVSTFSKAESIQFERAEGSIINKITLENVRIKGVQGLPKDSDITVKHVYIRLVKFSKAGLFIDMSKGMLVFPKSEPVYFSGKLEQNFVNLLINSSLVNIQQLSHLFPNIKLPQSVSGNLKELELKISGPLEEQAILGTFSADNIVYENLYLEGGVFHISANARNLKELASMKGLITIENVEVGSKAAVKSTASIQKTEVVFDTQYLNLINIKVFNGRLSLPGSERILFYGNYESGLFNFNFYSKRAGIESLICVLDSRKTPVPLKGSFVDIDFNLRGPIHELMLQGTAYAEKLSHGAFSLSDAPFSCDVILREAPKGLQVNGTVIVEKGAVSGQGRVMVHLEGSRLIFSGDPKKPSFDIKGVSKVEKTKIRIALKGTMEKPDLRLSSEPPLSQEQLLVMLTTGKRWVGIDTLFSNGVISPNLAMDFIDYFVLGGSGSKIADKFGITGLSVTLDKTTRGIEFNKSVSDKIEVGYGVLQKQNKEKAPEISQKISGEYKVTETIAVDAEKELKQANTPGQSPEEQKTDDKVMIKFKRNF